jgi:hypothetical protein
LAREKSQRLPQWIANTPMPVLDLYNSRDNGWSQTTVSQREIASIKSLKLQYQQRELLGFDTYPNVTFILVKKSMDGSVIWDGSKVFIAVFVESPYSK